MDKKNWNDKFKAATDFVTTHGRMPKMTKPVVAKNWDETCKAVGAWMSVHGRMPTPQKTEEKRLGAWCDAQRTKYRSGQLDIDRIHQLEAMPGWYWGRSRRIH